MKLPFARCCFHAALVCKVAKCVVQPSLLYPPCHHLLCLCHQICRFYPPRSGVTVPHVVLCCVNGLLGGGIWGLPARLRGHPQSWGHRREEPKRPQAGWEPRPGASLRNGAPGSSPGPAPAEAPPAAGPAPP